MPQSPFWAFISASGSGSLIRCANPAPLGCWMDGAVYRAPPVFRLAFMFVCATVIWCMREPIQLLAATTGCWVARGANGQGNAQCAGARCELHHHQVRAIIIMYIHCVRVPLYVCVCVCPKCPRHPPQIKHNHIRARATTVSYAVEPAIAPKETIRTTAKAIYIYIYIHLTAL